MKILFLPKYDRKAASFRYRFLQYFPSLDAAGVECCVSPLFSDEYLSKKFQTGRSSPVIVLKAFLRRIKVLLFAKKDDLLVLHCEAIPYFPALLERYLKFRGIKYIFDYDDAIFHNYDHHRLFPIRIILGRKIRQVARHASFVMAGCDYLAQYAKPVNNRVAIIPTVIDLEKYPRLKAISEKQQPFRIGWIGSPSTSTYLDVVYPALKLLSEQYDVVVTLIGAKKLVWEGVRVGQVDWSEESEVDEMLKFDVGIMPLPDTPWTRGKCGFKLIQYMACGLPVIASPVGVNNDIVEPGVNGFLCSTTSEWVDAFKCLIEQRDLRRRMGNAGREKIEKKYCLQVTAPTVIRIFESVANNID